MKMLGVKNRCRVFEIPTHIKYIKARPRMSMYIKYAADIYQMYLEYISKEDRIKLQQQTLMKYR